MLKAETLTGAQMKAAGIDAGGDQVAPDQQVVVTRFAPVKKGQSIRLRLSETYTAPQSYRVDGDEFVFERSLGRPRNSVVLPRGWYLTALSIPAVIRQTPDGLTRVDFVNGRPDSVDVLMKGRALANPRRQRRLQPAAAVPLASRHDPSRRQDLSGNTGRATGRTTCQSLVTARRACPPCPGESCSDMGTCPQRSS